MFFFFLFFFLLDVTEVKCTEHIIRPPSSTREVTQKKGFLQTMFHLLSLANWELDLLRAFWYYKSPQQVFVSDDVFYDC